MGGRSPGTAACVEDAESFLARGTRSQEVDGDLPASRRWFEAAYREARRTADAPAVARAALGLGGLWVHEHRSAVASARFFTRLQEALNQIDPDSELALRLRVRLAAEADYASGKHASILSVLDEVRTAADPMARMEALSLAHHCLLGPDDTGLRRGLADELVGEAVRADRRGDLLMGLLWQVVDRYLDADPHAPRRLMELRAMLAEGAHLAIGYVVCAIDVMLTIRAGRFDEAERLARECRDRGVRAGDADAEAWYGAQLVAIRWYQGRLPELLPMLDELVGLPTLSAVDNSFVAALAVAAAQAGDCQTAAGALATLRGRSLSELPRSSSWLVTMYGIVEAAHLLENVEASARAYELLRPYADLPMTVSLAVACFGSVHHALGVASLTTGDLDRAATHLREATHRNKALGHWPAVISSRLRYAEALLRRAQPGDEAMAYEFRACAAEEAATLGLPLPVEPIAPVLAPQVTCARQHLGWRIEMGTRSVQVEHSVGMLHLAVLTANPGLEIAAIDLVAGVSAVGEAVRRSGLSAQPILDRAAVQEYRQRLSQLQDEIDDRQSRGDRSGANRAEVERDWILGELAGGTGLGGRSRTFADNHERARVAVGRAIRRTLGQVERADPLIGAHLRSGVHTGRYCWYRPA